MYIYTYIYIHYTYTYIYIYIHIFIYMYTCIGGAEAAEGVSEGVWAPGGQPRAGLALPKL
jgi:hypothetical protein